jgi:Rieske Fe-S protein
MPDGLRRRTFCPSACKAACFAALSAPQIACDQTTNLQPTGPTGPVAGPPTPQPIPEQETPPSPSGVIVSIPTVPVTVEGRTASIAIGADSPLAVLWGTARVGFQIDFYPWDFLITRTGAASFTALFATCTHQGCLVSLVDSPVFECACHGSRYDHNGAVVRGPAAGALGRLPTQYADGVLRISF